MADAIYKQFLSRVEEVIRDLSLDGIGSREVKVRKFPYDDHVLHKGITVSPDEERIDDSDPVSGTNNRDMVGYPASITMVSGTSRGWDERLDNRLMWREAIRRAFHNKRISKVWSNNANRVICKVTHGGVYIPQRYLENQDFSQLTVWGWWMEPRSYDL